MDERYIEIDGISIRYVSKGKGPALLLFHGIGEFLETWSDNIDSLSRYYKVYALDLPGHGLSQKPEVNYTLDFATNFALSFMDALGIEHAGLIGHSVTGSLCLNLATRFAGRVDSLILVGSTGLNKKEASQLYRIITLLGRRIVEPTKTDVLSAKRKALYNPDIVTEELLNKAYQYLMMSKTKDAILNVLQSNVDGRSIKPEAILANRLHLVRSPALIVHGAQDRVIQVEHARVASNLIPGARLEVFDECGHCPHIEKPEEFNRAALAFLRG